MEVSMAIVSFTPGDRVKPHASTLEGAMEAQIFNAGDRVRTVAATAYTRIGMTGIIQQVYLFDRVFYDIKFDGEVQSRLIAAWNLERVNDAPLTERHV
jgi:hypothetical protein